MAIDSRGIKYLDYFTVLVPELSQSHRANNWYSTFIGQQPKLRVQC